MQPDATDIAEGRRMNHAGVRRRIAHVAVATLGRLAAVRLAPVGFGLIAQAMIVLPAAAQSDDAQAAAATSMRAMLPQDLSPWSMFMNADIVVKAVMVGLAIASLVTWTVWLVKALELLAAKRRARSATRKLARADNLAQARSEIEGGWTRQGRHVFPDLFQPFVFPPVLGRCLQPGLEGLFGAGVGCARPAAHEPCARGLFDSGQG